MTKIDRQGQKLAQLMCTTTCSQASLRAYSALNVDTIRFANIKLWKRPQRLRSLAEYYDIYLALFLSQSYIYERVIDIINFYNLRNNFIIFKLL